MRPHTKKGELQERIKLSTYVTSWSVSVAPARCFYKPANRSTNQGSGFPAGHVANGRNRHEQGRRIMKRGPYRHSYADEPGLREQVFALMDVAFPGLAAHARALEPFGLRWDQVSTPFLLADGDQLVGHVGVLEMPLVIDGQAVSVGGVHTVCTHPEHRRRGYFRLLMNQREVPRAD